MLRGEERNQGVHRTVSEPKAKVCHYTQVPAEVYGDEAPGVTIRWIIDEHTDGAPTYALRLIEVAPGGHTPCHSHPYEHETFVIEGRGRVQIDGAWHDVGPGYVTFVPPNAQHTYVNAGGTPFKMLCGIPVSRLRGRNRIPPPQGRTAIQATRHPPEEACESAGRLAISKLHSPLFTAFPP